MMKNESNTRGSPVVIQVETNGLAIVVADIVIERISELLLTMKNMELEGKFLSSVEAAKLFKPEVTSQSIVNWCKKGYFNSYIIGGRRYYKYVEIIAAIKIIKRYRGLNKL